MTQKLRPIQAFYGVLPSKASSEVCPERQHQKSHVVGSYAHRSGTALAISVTVAASSDRSIKREIRAVQFRTGL